MANDYFDFLSLNSSQEKPDQEELKRECVNLTTRADAECTIMCDGDFLELIAANQIAKIEAPVGQHILQFISTEHPDIVIEKVVDFPVSGKNYVLLVNEFHSLISAQEGNAKQDTPMGEAKGGTETGEGPICFVDLGLSVKWANKNVAFDDGYLSAWPKTLEYNVGDVFYMKDQRTFCDWHGKNYLIPNGCRIPTLDEIKELLEKCDWEKLPSCYKVKSRVNSNFIYLFRQSDGLSVEYWSGSNAAANSAYALCLGDEVSFSNLCCAQHVGKIRLVK